MENTLVYQQNTSRSVRERLEQTSSQIFSSLGIQLVARWQF